MVDKNNKVFAQKCKGRPSLRRLEEIRIYGELRSKLRQLRKEMSMKNGSKSLLSLSIAPLVFSGILHGCHFKHEPGKT